MLWVRVSDIVVNLEDVQGLTVNETVEGKFTLVVLFKNGQTVSVGDYSEKSAAIADLENFLQKLAEQRPTEVLR